MVTERITRLMQQAAVWITAVILGLAAILQFRFMMEVYSRTDLLTMTASLFLVILPLFSVAEHWQRIVSSPKREIIVVVWLMALAASIRLILLPILSTDAWSDMLAAHLFALDVLAGQPTANLSAYAHIPATTYLNMLGFTLAGVYKLLGASFQTAKLFMTLCATVTTGLMYYSGKTLGQQDGRIGFVGALAFATLPSMAAYTGVLTGEHIAIPFVLLVLLVFSKAVEKFHHPLKKIHHTAWYFALCGIFSGLLDWYRPAGIVLITALVIAFAFEKGKESYFFQKIVLLALLSVSYSLVSRVPIQISEAVFEQRIMSSSDRLGEHLLIGLNPVLKGVNNLNDWDIIAAARREFGNDFSGYRQYLVQTALSRIAPSDIIPILSEKFVRVWSNHEQLFFFASHGSNDQELLVLLRNVDIIHTIVLSLFAFIGVIGAIRGKITTPFFATQLFITGFTLIILIFEAQNRYMTLVIPCWILSASLGARQTFAWLTPHFKT